MEPDPDRTEAVLHTRAQHVSRRHDEAGREAWDARARRAGMGQGRNTNLLSRSKGGIRNGFDPADRAVAAAPAGTTQARREDHAQVTTARSDMVTGEYDAGASDDRGIVIELTLTSRVNMPSTNDTGSSPGGMAFVVERLGHRDATLPSTLMRRRLRADWRQCSIRMSSISNDRCRKSSPAFASCTTRTTAPATISACPRHASSEPGSGQAVARSP